MTSWCEVGTHREVALQCKKLYKSNVLSNSCLVSAVEAPGLLLVYL
jgi:hypothetical protein